MRGTKRRRGGRGGAVLAMLAALALPAARARPAAAIQIPDPPAEQVPQTLSSLAPQGSPLHPDPEPRAHVPFGPGERLEYQVKLGVISAGSGHISVEGVDTIRGRETYRLGMGISGRVLFAKVNDRYQSWLDTRSLVSRHFVRDVHEVRYKSYKEWAIYPEELRWVQTDEDDVAETMNTSEPLDELAFFFWLRTVPLEVGQTYTYHNYFKDDGNPVVIKVLRRESREVPAGAFDCIVVQPIIQTSGLFSQGGKAEIYLTDDAERHVVYVRSEIPVMGSITMHLRSIQRGTPLPGAAAPAAR